MKRLISVVLILVLIFSFAGCALTDRIAFSDESYDEKVSKLYAEQEKEKEKASVKREETLDDVIKDAGKSEEGKRIVSKIEYVDSVVYEVLVFKKDGSIDYRMEYKIFSNFQSYNIEKENYSQGSDKIVKYDDDALLLVLKNKDLTDITYDTMYALRHKYEKYEVIE